MPQLPDPWSTELDWSQLDFARFNPKATDKYGTNADIRFKVLPEVAKSVEMLKERLNIWDTKPDLHRFLHSVGLHVMAECMSDDEFKAQVEQVELQSQANDLEHRMAVNKALCKKIEDNCRNAESPQEIKAAIAIAYRALDYPDDAVRLVARKIVQQHQARSSLVIPDQIPDEWDD